MGLERVTLYRATHTVCSVEEIADWLETRIDLRVDVRDRFLDRYDTDALPEAFAAARVRSPYDRTTGSAMAGVIRYERRVLDSPQRAGGVLYDGEAIQRALNESLPPDERTLDHLHIAFLDRVIGTWGEHDGRWHKRIAVLGQPALVSIPGLSEAPAKPEEYYQKRYQSALLTGDVAPRDVLEGSLETDVIREDDARTTEALKGYALSAAHLLRTGEGFCDDPICRLSNPHTHEGVILAQFTPPEFCPQHNHCYRPSRQTRRR